MSLQRVSYVDESGRRKLVLLPEGVSSDEASRGIPIGPPDLSDLGLPEELEIRLNNELFAREIFTGVDALKRRGDVHQALQSALKIDAGRIIEVYIGKDYQNARSELAEKQPNTPVLPRRPRQPR